MGLTSPVPSRCRIMLNLCNRHGKMTVSYDRLLLVTTILLIPITVGSSVGSLYPGGVYSKTPVYCDSNTPYTTLRDNTVCFHQLTRSSCCMKTFPNDKGIIHQECLCGSSNNQTLGISSTQTITRLTTAASSSSTSTSSSTPTPTTASLITTSRSTRPASTSSRAPSTSTRAASTSTRAASTSTRVPSTSTRTTSTSTRAASTSTTTPKPPTTTQTRIPSTTTIFRSLCSSSSFRIMNGAEVENNCQYSGVANITQGDGSVQTCNAVYTRATVNGVFKPTFFTSYACINGIQRVTKSNIKSEIQIGNQAYPLTSDIFRLVEGPNGTAFIDIVDRYARILTDLDTCQKLACSYNKDKMEGILDFNDCKIVSWGSSSAGPAFTHAGLQEAALQLTPDGCSGVKDLFGASNAMCFRTTSGAKLVSLGDSGAPIYCKSTTNGEWILVGVAAEQLSWGTTADLKVIPYPE